MKKQLLIIFGVLINVFTSFAQIGINTSSTVPYPGAMLDVSSINKGVLLPRMSSVQMNAITAPATGNLIYNTDSVGYCYYTGTKWTKMNDYDNNLYTANGTINSTVREVTLPTNGNLSFNYADGTIDNISFVRKANHYGISVTSQSIYTPWINSLYQGSSPGTADGYANSVIQTVRARGTLASPQLLKAGDNMGSMAFMVVNNSVTNPVTGLPGNYVQAAGVLAKVINDHSLVGNDENLNSSLLFSVSDVGKNNYTAMTISNKGYLGVGTTNPIAKLHILTENYTGANLSISSTKQSSSPLYGSAGLETVQARSNNSTNALNNGDQVFRHTSYGKISSGYVPMYDLNVVYKSTTGDNRAAMTISVGGTERLTYNEDGNQVIAYNSVGGGVAYIYPAYNQGADYGSSSNAIRYTYTQNMYYNTLSTFSDARLKKNIENSKYGINALMQLRPTTYQFKEDKNNNTRIGFIAQEVQKVIPEIVNKIPNNYEEKLAIEYQAIIPVLIKSYQEQEVLMVKLKKQIEALEKK
jgi:hypothetical protein